jgi:Glycosyl hydrolase family 59
MKRRFLLPAAAVLLVSAAAAAQTGEKTVVLDGRAGGPIFDGIGAVSAGASSRLLIDYPEPYRSRILDYLFKPGYGAALQHLKVEIGADVNSTDGSEPSHMRTRQDENFHRGYEWWLLEEARKRNPKIILDILPWGAPGWVGGGDLYSTDMAQYVANFIAGAQSSYGLDIAYTGIWNEKHFAGTETAEYIKALRAALDARGLPTRIVCCDEYPRRDIDQWAILDAIKKDPALRQAIAVVSVHYPRVNGKLTTPSSANGIGKPLWSSEDQPLSSASVILSRDWAIGGRALAQLYNENYLKGGFTATEIWSPVTSYYDILAAPNSGLMYANTPWSGHYDVQGAIWATAHTTQFAQPGWQYLKSSCGDLPLQGDYVTLKSPNGTDWSVILETVGASQPQRVNFSLAGGLSGSSVHIWETNSHRTFERVADVPVRDGAFSYTFDPDSIYSLSTTTGQGKGNAEPRPSAPFPLPYRDDFAETALEGTPRYLADQDGAFEVSTCEDRPGRCLEQVISERPIPWGPLPDPWTLAGDQTWTDYKIDVDVHIEGQGSAMVLGRIDSADVFRDQAARLPSAYTFRLHGDGSWELLSTAYGELARTLAAGQVPSPAGQWRHLELAFAGRQITARLDGRTLASFTDSSHVHGMFGIGSGWSHTQFADLEVRRN